MMVIDGCKGFLMSSQHGASSNVRTSESFKQALMTEVAMIKRRWPPRYSPFMECDGMLA